MTTNWQLNKEDTNKLGQLQENSIHNFSDEVEAEIHFLLKYKSFSEIRNI